MGRKYDGCKRIPLSSHRLSRKKGWVLRRKMLKMLKLQNAQKNAQVDHDTNIKTEATDPQSSIGFLPNINSKSNTEMRYCLPQIKEEQMDEIEMKTETYDEESAFNGTNEYCNDNNGFVFVNVNSIEKTEGYNEDEYNENGYSENGYNEDNACNENIEIYEDSKDLISINVNNVEEIEDYIEEKDEESTCNEIVETIEIIEYYDYEDNRDSTSINIDHLKKTVYKEKGRRNQGIKYYDYEDNRDSISINIDHLKKAEVYKEKGRSNQGIKYYDYKNSRDSTFINIDYLKKAEVYKEKGRQKSNQGIKYFTNKKDNERSIIDINCPTLCIQENIPAGRCIINFRYFWSEAHKIFNNHSLGSDCQFSHWKLVNYRRRGLLTQFFFKCQMCRFEGSIWSEPVETKANTPDLNAIAVASSVAAGMGFSECKRSFESMDIVCMSHSTYLKHRRNLFEIQNNIESIANEVVLNEN